jgi:hypothetical protein
MRTPSISPDDVERDTYLVLDDFGGQLGCAWHETDVESADRETLIRDLLNLVPMSDNTLNKPLQFLGCDTGAPVATTARTASARPRRPCSTRKARSTAM